MLKTNPIGNTAYNYHQFQLIAIIQLIKINPSVIDIDAQYLLYSFSSAGGIVSILAYTKG